MSDLKRKFDEMVKKVAKGEVALQEPTNQQKLAIYALYKQATKGDAPEEADGSDMISRAKHIAWGKHQGMSKDEAMKKYIAYFK